jgi:hypothetical protein
MLSSLKEQFKILKETSLALFLVDLLQQQVMVGKEKSKIKSFTEMLLQS